MTIQRKCRQSKCTTNLSGNQITLLTNQTYRLKKLRSDSRDLKELLIATLHYTSFLLETIFSI